MLNLGFIFMVVASITLAIGFTSALGQEGEANFTHQIDTGICKGIENGDRIRIGVKSINDQELSDYAEEEGTITGNLVSCGDGVLVIMIDDSRSSSSPVRIPVDQLDWLEVSQGRSGHASIGAAIGMLTGMVVGVSLQREEAQKEWLEIMSKDEYQNAARIVGGAVGGLIVGAIVGSLIRSENWEKVFEDHSINLQGDKSMGEYQVAFGFSF